MIDPRINLLAPQAPAEPITEAPWPPRRRRTIMVVGVVFFVGVATLLLTNFVIPTIRLSYSFGGEGFWTELSHLTFSSERELQGENDDRVNVLLMGVGGTGHDGPLLTDTIMLVSFQPSSRRIALLSIPRDLSIPYPDGSWRRINEAYSLGEYATPGHGGDTATSTISTVLGLRIPYYVIINFNGFRKVIDELGGVRLEVEQSFTDPTFPNESENGGIHAVTFEQGWQWMDGERALSFARSRHGNNSEGSDFARAQRQQKILLAMKERLVSSSILLNPVTMNRLIGDLQTNITANLEPWEMLKLYRLGKNLNSSQVIRASLDDGPNGLLVDTRGVDGAFLLSPKNGDFGSIQRFTQDTFGHSPANTTGSLLRPARIEIQNGTSLSGLAATAASKLTAAGLEVVRVRNADERPVARTLIYDLTNGGRAEELAAIRKLFPAEVTSALPSWLTPTAPSLTPETRTLPQPTPVPDRRDVDFIIIIGTDDAPLVTRSSRDSLYP